MEDGFHFRHGLAPVRERPPIPGAVQTVADVLDRGFLVSPDAEALVGRDARYTYRELLDTSLRAAAVLADLGVTPGDRVGACLPNHTEIVAAFLGALRVGAVWVGIPQGLPVDETVALLEEADVEVLLADAATHDAVQARRRELGDLNQIVVAEPGDSEWSRAVAREEDPEPPEDFDPFDPAAIAWTGDAGRRGIVHSQHNLVLPGAAAFVAGETPPAFRHGVCLPLTVLDVAVLGPLRAFQTGGCCVVLDRMDPPGLAAWVRDERIGAFAALPGTVHDLLDHPDVGPDDLGSLERIVVVGAEPHDPPERLRTPCRERFGCELVIGHGLPEAPGTVTRVDPDATSPGSCGRALPHLDVVVVDEVGRELPDGEEGEVALRAARSGTFAGVWTPPLGYWNRPEATAAALAGGVLRTGERGRVDAHGNLFVTARGADPPGSGG